MKAKIYYRRPDPTLPHNKWKYTVKTIEVSKNECTEKRIHQIWILP